MALPDQRDQVEGDPGAYRRLAQALDDLPHGFPPTDIGIELEILKILFTPEEARLAQGLSDQWETAEDIARRLGLPSRRVAAVLRLMGRKELVQGRTSGEVRQYRLNQFIVGSWETTMFRLKGEEAHRLAHLTEEYVMATGGLVGIMRPDPAIHRVIPAQSGVKTEWILPYDDVKAVLMEAESFFLRDCVCRKAQDLLGKRQCSFTRRACLSFSPFPRPPGQDSISRDEALAFIDEAEREGLVHTVSNVATGINAVCNCCGCCCGILRGIVEFGVNRSVAHANYVVVLDESSCSACGLCRERCHVGAIELTEGEVHIDRVRCIGCGLCASSCPSQALEMQLKPPDEILHPPGDLASWERLRRANRTAD